MTETPVSRLIPRMALPCVVSMLVTAFYNMAGTENIFSVAQHSKDQSPSYALRAIWQDADESLSVELRAKDTNPPDTAQFLLQWDALLAGFSRTP